MPPPPLSSAEQVDHLLNRIGAIDSAGPKLRSVLAVNPNAMSVAIERDAERRDGRWRGRLHGVPVLVKDNIDTADLDTTAGSLALVGHGPTHDAPIVTRLRDAGAVLLGKANLSEWANLRSPHATSGWSAIGGLTRNPWDGARSAGGSSSGSGAAVAAGLTPLAVGTETDGSIVCPASLNGVVGLKPTVGLLPGAGIVPISHSQDSAGPMARTVREIATLLDVLAASDDEYSRATDVDSPEATLRESRIGIARGYFGDHPGTDTAVEQVLSLLSQHGATLVDPVDAPTMPSYDEGDDELTVLLHELKHDLATYLTTRPEGSPRSLDDIVAFNRAHAEAELTWFGQEFFEQAMTLGGLDDDAYLLARSRGLRTAKEDGLDAVLARHELDALVAPAFGPAWLSDLVNGDQGAGGRVTTAPSVAGYPIISLPIALVHGLPVGLAIVGGAGSEETLLRLAHSIETMLGLTGQGAFVPPV